MVADIEAALLTIGLTLSVDKTVWAATPAIAHQSATFGTHEVTRSETVPFLGSTICPGNPGQEDTIPRISKAWG
eukprot:3053935-Amphidinium_carterae.1